jgi:hypothetical protein
MEKIFEIFFCKNGGKELFFGRKWGIMKMLGIRRAAERFLGENRPHRMQRFLRKNTEI